MLKAKAEIQFTLENRNFNSRYFRPIFNFGNGLLFTGFLKSDHNNYLYNEKYMVNIDFFTIKDEAYGAVQPLLKDGMDMAIQEGANKIVGIAKVWDFAYEK